MQASQVTGELHLPLSSHVHESCLVAGARLGATSMGCSSAVAFVADEELDMLLLLLVSMRLCCYCVVDGRAAVAVVMQKRQAPRSIRLAGWLALDHWTFSRVDRVGTVPYLTKWESHHFQSREWTNQNAACAKSDGSSDG